MLNIFHSFNGFYKAIGLKNQYFPQYNESIFFGVGLLTFLLPILFSYLYYKLANGLENFNALRHTIHWAIFGVINLLIIVLFTLMFSKSRTQLGSFDFFMYQLSFYNAVISSVLYFLSSLYFKRLSKHASEIPIAFTPFHIKK